jgi:hypothetical protein
MAKLRDFQPDAVPRRVSVLFTVRESDENDRSLFAGMAEQTLIPYRQDPWIAALLVVGLAPLDADESFWLRVEMPEGVRMVEVAVTRLRLHGTTVLRFQTGPYVHLWAMSSAAKENVDGDNSFTELWVAQVRELMPQVIATASITRLVRSVAEGGLVTNVVSKYVDQLWFGGYHLIELTGPSAQWGLQAFSQMASGAAAERDAIVARTVTGRMGRARGGLWPYGKSHVPFGYAFDERARCLLPDPSLRERVRAMLEILGNQDSAPSVLIDRLAELQIPNRRQSNPGLLAYSTAARTNPRSVIDSLLGWASLWVTGQVLYAFACPYRGVKELNGAPVVTSPDRPQDHGEMQVLLTPGVPEGGWAEPDVLHAFAQAALARKAALSGRARAGLNRPLHQSIAERALDVELLLVARNYGRKTRGDGGVVRKRGTVGVAPFSGFSWSDERGLYEIKVAKSTYKLERRAWLELPIDGGVSR